MDSEAIRIGTIIHQAAKEIDSIASERVPESKTRAFFDDEQVEICVTAPDGVLSRRWTIQHISRFNGDAVQMIVDDFFSEVSLRY